MLFIRYVEEEKYTAMHPHEICVILEYPTFHRAKYTSKIQRKIKMLCNCKVSIWKKIYNETDRRQNALLVFKCIVIDEIVFSRK